MISPTRTAAAVVALFLASAAPTLAQADSALAVSANGVGLFRVNVDGGAVFGGTFDNFDPYSYTGSLPAEGPGTRLVWFPRRAAFRAGYVEGTQWYLLSIGYMSAAVGYNTRASGDYSMAAGNRTSASGPATFAVGEDNTASGYASVAMGYHAHTNSRQGSFVFADRSSADTLRAGVSGSASWRVSGGFRVFTSANLSTGVTIQSGASASNWGQSRSPRAACGRMRRT